MQGLWATSFFDGGNASYIDELYERYLENPEQVPEKWRAWFDTLPKVDGIEADTPHSKIRQRFVELTRTPAATVPGRKRSDLDHELKQVRVLQLINAWRFLGHRAADIDPLELVPRTPPPELNLAEYELSEADLDTVFNTGSLAGPDQATLREIQTILRETYGGHLGTEYMHIAETEEKRWIQDRLEGSRSHAELDDDTRLNLLERLTAAEGLEHYLHTRYVGQKRFSLEGSESLIPLLEELVQRSGSQGVKELVIGMAHRGRLNVLVNVLGKNPGDLFAEFEGKNNDNSHTGDVKYHMGFSSDVETPGGPLHLVLAFNPSHLEIVGPVVEGSVRARQERRGDRQGDQVLPVVIHGDAALAGQGVVMETLNMSQTRGFSTKGTVHIVINNQIGFTTSVTKDARSTFYCTDIAKMVGAPIFHVNGDDPEAVLFVTRLALDYRMIFNKDVFIDLVCYRRHGHNEADEPLATQPVMYSRIQELPTTRERYSETLSQAGLVDAAEADELADRVRERLEAAECMAPHVYDATGQSREYMANWQRYAGHDWDAPADTAISLDRLHFLAERMLAVPEDFEINPRVAKLLGDRHRMAAGELPADWGFAETLAYASLATQGYNVRLSGQDSGRGTFFHRQAVLHHQGHREAYIPLRHLSEKQGNFLIIDSLLSEEAVLAFEYGFATADPETLVIWEAQFGDFANGAQVVIDQFISSGEQKWNRLCGLTLFLPHGYEGQGPEHSSGRLERYLQLCAQQNMQVCVPTTPAQMFHLLRRQIIRPYRKPLIVMTPKSLLRHKLATNTLEDFTHSQFQPVIDDIDPLEPEAVDRILLCTGKIYYDLLERRRADKRADVAIMRVEQLYPFPRELLEAVVARYPNVRRFIWVQEEPLNQGAWYATQHQMRGLLKSGQYLEHVTRPDAASPAVGYFNVHLQQQKAIVEEAFA
ncbi:MAG: 2-oxoglutarate dehydrogenase E1 component [Gammaproteobacteria bacterium]